MLGDTQERWLYDGFKHARTRWTVLGQQVMVMRCDRDPDPHVLATSMDKWDGAVAARDRLLAAVEDARLSHLIVLTGDVPTTGPGNSRRILTIPTPTTLGIEFVATSISSGGMASI